MKKVSRILALLLAICMILSALPTVFAEGELTGKVIEDGPDMLKYGHIDIDIPAAKVLEVYDYGEIVNVDLGGFGRFNVPVCASYDDVASGEMLLRVVEDKDYVILAINYGQIAVQQGLVELAPEDSATKYQVCADVVFPIEAKIGDKYKPTFEGTVIEDGPDMLKYGHVDIDLPAKDILEFYKYGDVLTVTLEGYGSFNVPVCASYDDVASGEMLLRVVEDKDYVILAINYGQIAVEQGIVELAPEGSETKYQVCADVTFPIKATIAPKELASFEGKVIEDGPDMLKYGHIDIDIPADELLAKIPLGTQVTVEVEGYETFKHIPVCASYDDVASGEMLLRAVEGKPYLILAINYGQVAVQQGLVEVAPEGSATKYQVCAGVTFPIKVTITEEEGKVENLLGDLKRTDVRENYPDLTDAQFANFRNVEIGDILPNTFYRASSPINPEIGRNKYADAAAKEAGVKTFINLADTEAEATGYPDYAESYYSAQNHIFLGLPVAFTTDTFRNGLAEGMRYIIANEGPYLVHCTEGKDRAGLTAAILECLCGATYEEVLNDYVETYRNYYSVEGDTQRALTEKEVTAIEGVILANLKLAFGVEIKADTDLEATAKTYLVGLGLTEEEVTALREKLCGSESELSVETTFPSATKADIDKYGDVHFSISSAELAAAGFAYKDLVKLSFLDQELIVPIIPEYRYVGAKAVGLVMWEDGSKPAEVEVFNGSFAASYGLADVVRDGSEYTVTPREGVVFPVPVTITMYEEQGYADTYAIFDLVRSNVREDYRGETEPYPDLTDAEFANFRMISTTGMGNGTLYRASSPINPSIGRNTYADAASRGAGILSFVNLADSESSAAKYEGYADTYYSKQNICFLNLGVDFTTELNRAGLKTAMEFIAAEESKAPFLIHCNEGQDRAGFVSALLECLMGATYDEVVADYMLTFYNYYGVKPGTDQYNQISNNIVKNLSTAFGLQMSELADADLAAKAEAYFKQLDVSDETIAAVKEKLAPTAWDGKVTIVGTELNVSFSKYGNTYTDCTSAHFTGTEDNGFGFKEGDIVTVKFLEQSLDLPVGTNYSDVDSGTPMIKVNADGYIELAINMGNFGSTYGLVDIVKDAETGNYTITPKEGVEFPVEVTFELKEAQGYAAELAMHRLVRTNNREDYADLTDAEFANFRQVTTTGMGDHLYRGSSPINPEIGRNTYANAELEKAGVTVIMNLADSEEMAKAYEGFDETYYSKQKVVYLNLGVDFTSDDFKAGLANGLRFFAENEGIYYFHCTEGKDRAGFVAALLECLMGATADEVVKDYMVTYYNYYGVKPEGDDRYEAIANSNIVKTLKTAFEVEDLAKADLAAEAAEYIKAIGLKDEEIDALKKNLATENKNPFTDVKEDSFFYDAVLWAVSKEVTNGTTATTFSPEETCTRGQVVTFLWRAKGCPEPTKTENPFKDVKETDYFYKAVLWAVENEITNGTSADTFSPAAGCTRGQVVTFLWRAEGKPAPEKTENPFGDVKDSDFYYDAVLWAVEKEITKGTSEKTFSPLDTCTRGQIVTFLYRDLA